MSRFGKYICLGLLVFLMISLLPPLAFEAHGAGFSVQTPATHTSGAYNFTALPGVYEMGDGYAVIWATSFQGTGYIRYTYRGKEYTVYDQKNGILRTGDTVHVVKVPHEHLLGNSYTVYSQVVTGHSYAVTSYGTTISAGPITLKAYDGGTQDFDLLVLTDTHGKLDWTKTIASQFTQQDPDLVVFSGDVTDSLTSKSDIELMFNIMGTTTGGRYPIVYCRGNHEIRGKYSTTLLDYFPTETGEFYFDFTYGPLYGVVLDTGEDKMDSHQYYGNLANFQEYHAKQEAWLRTLRRDENATYRLGIYHIARIHNLSRTGDNLYNYTDSIGHLGLQLAVTGHFHNCSLYDRVTNNGTSIRHESVICGGYETDQATMVTLNRSDRTAYLTSRKSSGAYGTFHNRAVPLSQYVTDPPAPLEQPERGLANHFNKSTPNTGISLVTQPAVFETGGDWYNILWKTKITSASGKGSTGYVEYRYNGQTYQVFDEVGGYRRTFDDYHCVRVPKEHLNNNTYKVGSFLMTYSATSGGSRYYTAGGWVESPTYLFEDRRDDTAVTLFACPDIEALSGNTAPITQAAGAVAGLGTSPAYILLGGNTVGQTLNTGDDFTNLIQAAATVSGSIHPVILSRGYSECRGFLAPNLQKYFPTATGEFYYTVDVGDYTLVNLDTAEDDPDGQIISYQGNPNFKKYGGRVFFDQLRREQAQWLSSLPSGKLIPISSRPLADHDQAFGTDYEAILLGKGAVAAIAGHPDDQPAREQLYTLIPQGNQNGMEVASLTIGDGVGYVKKCKSDSAGNLTYPQDTAVALSDGSALHHTPTAPPLSGQVYTVTQPEHLHWLSQQCRSGNSFSGYTFRLANDIDLQLVPFTPIGGDDLVSSDSNTTSKAFAGSFEGNGYTIRNLNIHSTRNNVGLFGAVRGGTISQLTVAGGTVTGGWYVGGLAGFASGTTVEDCYVDVTVYSPKGSKIGGIIGFATEGTAIRRCASYGHLIGCLSNGSIGGILGQGAGNQLGTIQHSYNRGTVSAHGTQSCAGGLIGYLGSAYYQLSSGYNAAPVTGCGKTGGIIGNFESAARLTFSGTYFVKSPKGATNGSGNSNSWNTAGGSGFFTVYTPEAMQTESFAKKLGSAVFTYAPQQNDGYPVHWNALHHGQSTHSYRTEIITAPTCLKSGTAKYLCACGDQYTGTVPPLGHSYTTQLTRPTCLKSGYTTYTCTVCADSYQGDITPATGHSYQPSVTRPTCLKSGYTTYTCLSCAHSYQGDITSPTGHSYEARITQPTCTQSGFTHYTCINCADSYQGDITQATGHRNIIDPAVAPTCTQPGLTEGSHCGYCAQVLIPQKTAPATGHRYVQSVTAPTCTKDGFTVYTCASCHDTYTGDTTPALGHSPVTDKAIAPTCTQPGLTEGSHCGRCSQVLTPQKTLPATGHSYVQSVTAPTCTKDGFTVYTCASCHDTYTGNTTPALGHSPVTDKAVSPTCTQSGLTEGSHCGRCSQVLTHQKPLPATGHSYRSDLTLPTCTQSGYTVYTCTACAHSYRENTAPATGHAYDKAITPPTCTSGGYTVFTCAACEDTYTGDTTPALGHSPVTDKAVPSTCTQPGLTEGSHCGRCNTVLKKQKTVPASGHSYGGNRLVKIPTFQTAGILRSSCIRCGKAALISMPLIAGKDYTQQITRTPTCTTPGLRVYTWQDATYGTVSFTQSIPTIAHRYRYRVTKLPTRNMIGILTGTCATCGHRTGRSLPPLSSAHYLTKPTAPGEIRCIWKTTTYGVITFTTNLEEKKAYEP